MKKNIIILLISALAFICLIVFLSLLLGEHFQVQSCGCPKMVSQNFVWLFIFLSIIFIGGIVYYLLSLKIEKKDRTIGFNLSTIMKFLDNDEKNILRQLKQNNGEILQSKIKKINKLRSHRAIKKLEEKEILKTIKQGKINKITLNNEFNLK